MKDHRGPASPSVLVTGCSSGIGHAAAHALVRRGWRVFATARQRGDVARLGDEGLEALPLDLACSESIAACVAEVLDRTDGRLDALFNNGAYGQPGAVEDLSRAVLRAQLETNLLGTHELTTRVIPAMREQGGGRIVQNSSVLGFAALPYRGAYVCSKYALEGLTDTLRQELYGTGIHVSLIEPGPIISRFRENAYRAFLANIDAAGSYRLSETWIGRAGEPTTQEQGHWKPSEDGLRLRLSLDGTVTPNTFRLSPTASSRSPGWASPSAWRRARRSWSKATRSNTTTASFPAPCGCTRRSPTVAGRSWTFSARAPASASPG